MDTHVFYMLADQQMHRITAYLRKLRAIARSSIEEGEEIKQLEA